MKRSLGIILVVCFSFVPSVRQVASAAQREIMVSAAISLKNAFEEIGRSFERTNRDVRVVFNFGPSGGLLRQIEAGAPVDVFASASREEMEEVERKGMVLPRSRVNFAANTPVLIVPLRTGRVRITSFADLKNAAVKRIAIGNPKTVPAGRYAEEVLRHYGLLPSINEKLVFAENVRQVLDYTARGEVDAGVVYKTDALLRPSEVTIVAEAPPDTHEPTVYPIAAIKGTRNEAEAGTFIQTVTSPAGKKILRRYGFRTAYGNGSITRSGM
jgi:molybdate transport system substrate-binding protein